MWYCVLSRACLKAAQGERKPEFSLELADTITQEVKEVGPLSLLGAEERTFHIMCPCVTDRVLRPTM